MADPDSRLEPTVREVASPLGTLRLAAADGWLCLAEFIGSESHWGGVCDRIALRLGWRFGSHYHTYRGNRAVLDAAARQLEEYFAASRTEFELPVWAPGRRLEEQVWQELLRSPRGQLRTFGQTAEAIGRPRAASSIAQAVGQNRLMIIIPCHRAVPADGRLTNRGVGQWAKRRLLELERTGCADCLNRAAGTAARVLSERPPHPFPSTPRAVSSRCSSRATTWARHLG